MHLSTDYSLIFFNGKGSIFNISYYFYYGSIQLGSANLFILLQKTCFSLTYNMGKKESEFQALDKHQNLTLILLLMDNLAKTK